MPTVRAFVLLALLAPACRAPSAAPAPPPVAWQAWAPSVFATARAERRLVLLDLGASWCHWCHVMERTTYVDPEVRDVLARHFVAVEADADERLDLAARYQEWGWPATIVFDADGRELWKNRGYVAAAKLRDVLLALVADPRPLAPAATAAVATAAPRDFGGLAEPVRTELLDRMRVLWDDEHAGFGFVHKYLDLPGTEWLLGQARGGDATARARLLRLLDAERALHDPVWGGAFQYSHGGVWTNPHFEKVMERQLADLRGYSLAFGAFGREPDLAAAQGVARFLLTMLAAPEGAFYASQDADAVPGEHAADYFALPDAARRARGVPRIERNLWSRENGQAITGLCALQAVDPDPARLAAAVAAANWIVANRRRDDGTFAHGDHDVGGPFLADSLAMTAAALALAEVTAEPQWLALAERTVLAIATTFGSDDRAGHAAAIGDGVLPPAVDRDENIQLARLANRVHHATGNAACRRVAERAFAFVASEPGVLQPGLPAALLLAATELTNEPVHVVVVGTSDDAEARALHRAALAAAPPWRVVEWLAPGAASARGDVYPPGQRAHAFVCRDGACSPPIDAVDALRQALGVPAVSAADSRDS